jgi:hypothetical protein
MSCFQGHHVTCRTFIFLCPLCVCCVIVLGDLGSNWFWELAGLDKNQFPLSLYAEVNPLLAQNGPESKLVSMNEISQL